MSQKRVFLPIRLTALAGALRIQSVVQHLQFPVAFHPEEQTKTWDQLIVIRHVELDERVEICRKIQKRRIQIFAYANNHYAGHAPAAVELFQALWQSRERAGTTNASKPPPSGALSPK